MWVVFVLDRMCPADSSCCSKPVYVSLFSCFKFVQFVSSCFLGLGFDLSAGCGLKRLEKVRKGLKRSKKFGQKSEISESY
jgi:hypothetical protein